VDNSVFVSIEDSGEPVMYFVYLSLIHDIIQVLFADLVSFIESDDATAGHALLKEQTQAYVEQ
jgi:hypothetical protein